MNHVGLVAGRGLGGELGVELDGRLRVVDLEINLASEQAAGGIDLVDCHAGRVDHRLAVDVETARLVEDRDELDIIRGSCTADYARHGQCGS